MRVPALLKLPASQCRKPCVAGNQGSLVVLALVSRLAGIMLRAACHVRLCFCFSWICWACGRVQGLKRLQSVGSYRLRVATGCARALCGMSLGPGSGSGG